MYPASSHGKNRGLPSLLLSLEKNSPMTRLLVLLLLVLPFTTAPAEENPPAKGFNTAASDPKAISVADQAMTAMGGRKNWDATRYITWRFFGFRLHVWDKWTGDIRFE